MTRTMTLMIVVMALLESAAAPVAAAAGPGRGTGRLVVWRGVTLVLACALLLLGVWRRRRANQRARSRYSPKTERRRSEISPTVA